MSVHAGLPTEPRVKATCEVKRVLLIFLVSLAYSFTPATDELQCLVV